MTDTATDFDRTPAPSTRPRTAPATWGAATDAWRANRRLTRRAVNNLLRVRSASALPGGVQARIHAMGIPADITQETLREIRSLDAWPNAWIETAQRFLGDSRRQLSGSQRADAAQARLLAGLCYHIARLVPGPDERTIEHCGATAATLVGQALGEIIPQARRLQIPWRNHHLPAILIPGPDRDEPSSLVVMFNGTSTIKEELLRWSEPFQRAGHAVLLVDQPGSGEARELGPPSPDHNDLLDGVFDLLRSYPAIDAHRVGLLGVSLGGNTALRCLAYDRRIASAALVTPPHDPARWLDRVSPLEQEELRQLFGAREEDGFEVAAGTFALSDVVERVHRPVLVIGGARDLVVPPSDPTRLAATLGDRATLVWYPEGGHVLYEQIPAWTTDAAWWLDAVLRHQSTRVDGDPAHTEQWRAALDYLPDADTQEWDESLESARLLSPDEVEARVPASDTPEAGSDEAGASRRQPEFEDAYSRAFGEDSEQRRRRGRPSRAQTRDSDLPME